jgi:penicillin-insensitive murein endopeptidase
MKCWFFAALLSTMLGVSAAAQTPQSPPADGVAKELFGGKSDPADLQARAIGGYAKGCLAGASALPINGPTWQVMRLSRNRNWGHPKLVNFLERLATKVPEIAGWPGLLVGDLAQPRGGPMLTGHASHQIGLDADIWLTPMPDRTLTNEERESISAVNMVAEDWNDVDPGAWTPQHTAVIRAAAKDADIERIFVNPAIKKALCREAGNDRTWLRKVRPWRGHNWHFHVRMKCPADSPECLGQEPVGEGEGCGADLDWWFTPQARKPLPPGGPQRQMKLSELPGACRQVLVAP